MYLPAVQVVAAAARYPADCSTRPLGASSSTRTNDPGRRDRERRPVTPDSRAAKTTAAAASLRAGSSFSLREDHGREGKGPVLVLDCSWEKSSSKFVFVAQTGRLMLRSKSWRPVEQRQRNCQAKSVLDCTQRCKRRQQVGQSVAAFHADSFSSRPKSEHSPGKALLAAVATRLQRPDHIQVHQRSSRNGRRSPHFSRLHGGVLLRYAYAIRRSSG